MYSKYFSNETGWDYDSMWQDAPKCSKCQNPFYNRGGYLIGGLILCKDCVSECEVDYEETTECDYCNNTSDNIDMFDICGECFCEECLSEYYKYDEQLEEIA